MQSLRELSASQPLGPVTRSQKRSADDAMGSFAGREVKPKTGDKVSFAMHYLQTAPQNEKPPQALIETLSELDALPVKGLYDSLAAVIRETPEDQRVALIRLFPPAFAPLSLMDRGSMIYPLSELAKTKKAVPLLTEALPLMKDISERTKRSAMLLTLQDMAPDQVSRLVPLLARLFVGSYEPHIYIRDLLKIAPEERSQTLADALAVVEDLSDETRDRFWPHFCGLTPEERTELLTLMREVLAVLPNLTLQVR